MDLRDRFFGKGTPEPGGLPVANTLVADPPSFQLLYPTPLDLDADALTQALRDYHSELAQATAELDSRAGAAAIAGRNRRTARDHGARRLGAARREDCRV